MGMKNSDKIHYKRVLAGALLTLFLLDVILAFIMMAQPATGAHDGLFFMVANNIQLVIILPALIIVFVILYIIKKSNYERLVTKKKINVISLIFVIAIIIFSVYNYQGFRVPSEIIKEWTCEECESLCYNGSCSKLVIKRDTTVGNQDGYFTHFNTSYEPSLKKSYKIYYWDYDKFSNIVTLEFSNESIVKLKLDIKSSNKMTTYYVSDTNAPFDAKKLDDITWSA